jgi:DNA-directed RNA polymerase subunit omega
MARITVEDCEKIVANRFDLVVLAAQRTRQILSGDPITLESKDEKNPVIALREIAAQSVSVEALKESAIKNFRTVAIEDDLEDDMEDIVEEDTYNPYVGIEIAAIESSSNINIIDSDHDADDNDDEDSIDDDSLNLKNSDKTNDAI